MSNTDIILGRRNAQRRDPTALMYATHRLTTGVTYTTDDLFDSTARSEPITFKIPFVRDSASDPDGVLLELGSASRGVAIYFPNSDTLIASAGTDWLSPLTGAGCATLVSAVPKQGWQYSIVVAINPGTGVMRVWIDGVLQVVNSDSLATYTDYSKSVSPMGTWADTGDGRVGDKATDYNLRNYSPGSVTTTDLLSNSHIAGDVLAYAGQLPHHNFHV